MTDEHKKQKSTHSNTMNVVAAGIAGAIAGGAAIAATIILSDKNNQKKAKESLVGAKDKVTGYIDTLKKQPVIQKSADKIDAIVQNAKKIIT